MNRWTTFLAACLVALAWGCGGGGGSDTGAPDTGTDIPVVDDVPGTDTGDVPVDTAPDVPEVADDVPPADVPPADVPPADVPVATVSRHFTYRAIGGLSMGCQAMTVATHHPEEFDILGAMGGYIDYRYMGHLFRDKVLGGFCPMDKILANLDKINDPTVLDCGPVAPDQPFEYPWSFNAMHYNDNGGNWQREFYLEALGSFGYAFGNLVYYNPDNPLLPPGVSLEWMQRPAKDKCGAANAVHVGKPLNYNKEYNPEGKYDLITFCDGDSLPPGVTDRDDCAADPKCREHLGDYNPAAPHNFPVNFLLAVDYNGNGLRDYGEPIVVNGYERFQDVGADGCADELEDGKGGCSTTADSAKAGKDPNGDNFDLVKNPMGTEGNHDRDEGESYEDTGLDGVAGTGDFGEDDKQYTLNPNYKALIDQDVRTYLMKASFDEIRSKTWYFDGGIRDPLHAITSMLHLAAQLVARGDTVKVFDNFGGYPTSLVPDMTDDEILQTLQFVDYSPAAAGRNQLMEYGHPEAIWNDILNGDGGHVGLGAGLILRVANFFGLAMSRMPDVEYANDDDQSQPRAIWTSYWSEALQGRRWYVISVPPGYDDDANKDERYPLTILLPGIGMPLDSMGATAFLLQPMQIVGQLPKFLILYPDGQCTYRRMSDGKRFPGCVRSPDKDGLDCVDDTCKGPHATCTVTNIPESGMEQECNSGHFFVNHRTDIWGDTTYAPVMRYEDGLFELLKVVDQDFRTRKPEDRQVPATW